LPVRSELPQAVNEKRTVIITNDFFMLLIVMI
jgi:hypothetical protein